ncbi:MAG: amidohydrolase family protein [Gemmatimonadetes bacterium]|nr:amidohydrolase family protein [Gemmatimonadota bacterium]
MDLNVGTRGWERPALAAALIVACGGTPTEAVDTDPACALPTELGSISVFENVSLVSYATGAVQDGQSVVIREGRIEVMGADGEVQVPEGATSVPGCGRFLVPGLADMHVHLSRADLPSYLDAGVTTVRNLWGFPDLLAMKQEIESGTLDGPSIAVISSGLDGTPEKWPFTQLVMEAEDASPVIEAQVAHGYSTLKLYSDLRSEPFDAIVEDARARGLEYGGHVPHRVGLTRALDAGYRFIEHLSGYEVVLNPGGPRGAFAWRTIDESAIEGLVAQTVAAGTWNSPTLEIFAQIANGEAAVVENRRAFVHALHEAGAPLLVGTDSGIGRTQPGVSLHKEIAQFVAAGIPVREVLRIATEEAARFLGAGDDIGRVDVGFAADLLLVRENPIDDVTSLADPVAVLVRGQRVR